MKGQQRGGDRINISYHYIISECCTTLAVKQLYNNCFIAERLFLLYTHMCEAIGNEETFHSLNWWLK